MQLHDALIEPRIRELVLNDPLAHRTMTFAQANRWSGEKFLLELALFMDKRYRGVLLDPESATFEEAKAEADVVLASPDWPRV